MEVRCLACTLHYSWPTCTWHKIIKLILLWHCLGRGGLLWNTNSWGASCLRNRHHLYCAKPVPCQYRLKLRSIAPFGLVIMALGIILFCHKVLPSHELGILCWGTPPNLPTTPGILDSKVMLSDQMRPVSEGLMLQFLIFYCSGALAMIHLSCRTIPLLSVSQPRYIWAIDLLSLTLIGSHRQMCPCLRYMFSMVLSVGCECMVSLVHKAWFDDEFFVQPLVIYRRVLKKCHLSSGTGYPNFACLPGLWPILLRKSIVRVIRPSMYAQDFFSTNWSTPYQLSTFQLIRFTLIEALRWHITIKPS